MCIRREVLGANSQLTPARTIFQFFFFLSISLSSLFFLLFCFTLFFPPPPFFFAVAKHKNCCCCCCCCCCFFSGRSTYCFGTWQMGEIVRAEIHIFSFVLPFFRVIR